MGLEIAQTLISLEDHYDISISERQPSELSTVEGLVKVIIEETSKKGNSYTEDEIYSFIKIFISESYEININEISRDSRFFEDLGLE